MLGITEKEVELLGTFNLMLKMKHHQKSIQHFAQKFNQDPDNPENAFNQGLCLSVFMMIDTNDAKKLKYLLDINEAFEKCLAHNPQWWLVRYLRSELNEEILQEDVKSSSILPARAFENADPADDRGILIDHQEKAAKKPPYFFVPYIAQTRSCLRKGDFDAAVQWYRKGLETVPIKQSPYTFYYLTRPLHDTIVYLRKKGNTSLADEMKKHALTLFPDAGNLCMT